MVDHGKSIYIYIYVITVYIYKWMIWGYPLFRKSPNSEHSNIASPVTHRPRFGRPVFDCWYRVAGLNVSPLSHMLRGYFSKKMKMILMGKYGIIWDYVSSQWEIHYLMCFSTGFFGASEVSNKFRNSKLWDDPPLENRYRLG